MNTTQLGDAKILSHKLLEKEPLMSIKAISFVIFFNIKLLVIVMSKIQLGVLCL